MQHLVNSIDSVAYYTVPRQLRYRRRKYTHDEAARAWLELAEKYLNMGKRRLRNLDLNMLFA